jgi:hypothetical protein
MSFEAESNSELTVIVPAYQLHFRFPVFMVHDFISNFKWIAYAEHIIEQKSKILELFRISGITPERFAKIPICQGSIQ